MQRELRPIFFAAKNGNFIDVADFWEEKMGCSWVKSSSNPSVSFA
jgi:hypothetical protein